MNLTNMFYFFARANCDFNYVYVVYSLEKKKLVTLIRAVSLPSFEKDLSKLLKLTQYTAKTQKLKVLLNTK